MREAPPSAGRGAVAVLVAGAARWACGALCLLPLGFAALPSPESHFGHAMGEDRRLVGWSDVVAYFRRLERASDALTVATIGRSTEGRPMIVAAIAEPGTIADLDRYRGILAQLADPRSTPPDEADRLVAEGKPAVVITCSIHSTEVASTLTAVQFAHDLLAKQTPRRSAILENTILLLVPSLNPDGIDKVRSWYERWLGGPYEGAPMTELYHKYLGHDNNRDWSVFTQRETRNVVERIHNAWRPQIVYDVHQMGREGARIFVPPWIDPIDPNIDALIAQQVNAFGMAMASDLTARGRKGVVVNGIYDYYSPARHYQSYHGALRLLSESASARYATPVEVDPRKLDSDGRNYNAAVRSWNHLEPWGGGTWRLRDIVADQLIAFESVLYSAAVRRADLLRNFYRIGQRVVERGRGKAFLVPRRQHDPNAATRMLRILEFGDVEIDRAVADWDRGEAAAVSRGDYLIRLAQPYGSFAKTLLERQDYPDLRVYPGGPPRKPYDVTANTLPLLMGVDAFRLDGPIEVPTERVTEVATRAGSVAEEPLLALSPRFSSSWLAVHRLLKEGVAVHRDESDGTFLLRGGSERRKRLLALAAELGVDFGPTSESAADHPRLRLPRVALYSGHVPIMDEGWTRWLFDTYELPYRGVGDDEVAGGLEEGFDVLVLPDAAPEILEGGFSHQYGEGYSMVPPELRGGLGEEGLAGLRRFASGGGVVLAFNRAAAYLSSRLELPVNNALAGVSQEQFFGPGTLLNAEVDVEHPLCFGMRPAEAVWFQGGPAWRVRSRAAAPARQAVRYPRTGVRASGWLLGPGRLSGLSAVAEMAFGDGRLVLFGIRPQYRGQSDAAFKMVFNGLHLGPAAEGRR